jgi:segregation and condensation protein A
LLDLYRERIVTFEQLSPLGDLTVRWAGGDE